MFWRAAVVFIPALICSRLEMDCPAADAYQSEPEAAVAIV
jgi:hypothetical protein